MESSSICTCRSKSNAKDQIANQKRRRYLSYSFFNLQFNISTLRSPYFEAYENCLEAFKFPISLRHSCIHPDPIVIHSLRQLFLGALRIRFDPIRKISGPSPSPRSGSRRWRYHYSVAVISVAWRNDACARDQNERVLCRLGWWLVARLLILATVARSPRARCSPRPA